MYILRYFQQLFYQRKAGGSIFGNKSCIFLAQKKTFVGRTYTSTDNIYQMDNMNYTEAFPSIKTSDVIRYDTITVLKLETEMLNIVSET